MRIALFTDTFPPEVNGVANTTDRIARALAKRHAVCVFTVSKLTRDELQEKNGHAYKIETVPSVGLPIYLGVRTTVPAGLSLRQATRFKPDVIHSHTPFSMGWEAVWAARFLRIPLVGTHHTFFNHYLKHVHLDYAWAQSLSWELTVGYYNRCDLVTSPTASLAGELVAHGLKSPHEIVPNIVDTDLFRPPHNKSTLKSRLGLPDKVLIHVGRLSYEKSVDQAIRAFKLVAAKESHIVFVVAGDGPDKAELEALAKDLGLSERVRFTGFIHGRELIEYLQAADVFLTASKSENMPLAVLEGMAAGLPIIAVRSLGLAEIVEDGKNGYLVPPDDVHAIAARTHELLRDADLKNSFSRFSLALSKRYSEGAVTERLQILYTGLVQH